MESLEKIKLEISSANLEDQINGLNQFNKIADEISNLAISTLEKAPDKLFIAERIYDFHTIISRKLNILFDSTTDEKLQLHVALILFTNSSEEKFRSFLLNELNNPLWSNAELALHKLIQRNVTEAIPIITRLLEEVPVTEVDKIVMLLHGMKKLDAQVPEKIQIKFSAKEINKQIQEYL
jgi:hypothetical protein